MLYAYIIVCLRDRAKDREVGDGLSSGASMAAFTVGEFWWTELLKVCFPVYHLHTIHYNANDKQANIIPTNEPRTEIAR